MRSTVSAHRRMIFVLGVVVFSLFVGFAALFSFSFNPLSADAASGGCCGGSGNVTNNPNGNRPPEKVPSCTISSSPSTIKKGESSTVSWTSRNVSNASISNIGVVKPQGSVTVYPQQTTTYTFSSQNGLAVCSTTIIVTTPPPPPKDVCPNIPGNQEEVPHGYELKHGNCVPKEEPPKDVCPNIPGNQTTVPYGYELKYGKCVPIEQPPVDVCPNIPGNQSSVPYGYELKHGKCVPVEEEEDLSCDLNVSKAEIKKGESTTLSWTSDNAFAGFIDEGIGNVPAQGSMSISPTQTTTYIGSFWDDTETVTCDVTVTVKKDSKPTYEPKEKSYGGRWSERMKHQSRW